MGFMKTSCKLDFIQLVTECNFIRTTLTFYKFISTVLKLHQIAVSPHPRQELLYLCYSSLETLLLKYYSKSRPERKTPSGQLQAPQKVGAVVLTFFSAQCFEHDTETKVHELTQAHLCACTSVRIQTNKRKHARLKAREQ